MLFGNGIKRINPLGLVVQTGDEAIGLPTLFKKGVTHLHVDLLQGLQAIACKTRTDDINVFGTGLGQLSNGGLGVGFKPLGFAKAGLKGDFVLRG